MRKLTAAATIAAAASAITIASAGTASAMEIVHHYSGWGAEYACNADKNVLGPVPNSMTFCEDLNNGVYRLTIVPNHEIPAYLGNMFVRGFFGS
ncbi:hypothetical protein [Rhodococcus sp. WMMA185]|uniref:hypothetical protein n=1 Tax=Rhodococcus sp. WMMA185 TaxID=679318 RepID=UPI0012F50D21|nr:hypothetical protein [Rhodococcus sp. WMMA185]